MKRCSCKLDGEANTLCEHCKRLLTRALSANELARICLQRQKLRGTFRELLADTRPVDE